MLAKPVDLLDLFFIMYLRSRKMDLMERLGYIKKSRYEEVLESCKKLEEDVGRLEERLSELQKENEKLREKLEKTSKPQVNISHVNGVGAKRAEMLKNAGIETVKELAEVSVEALASVLESSKEFASKLKERARNALEKAD